MMGGDQFTFAESAVRQGKDEKAFVARLRNAEGNYNTWIPRRFSFNDDRPSC